MIDLLTILKSAGSIGESLGKFISYLSARARTSNTIKKKVFRELRYNLKRLKNRDKQGVKLDKLIASLQNQHYVEAKEKSFDFNKLAYHREAVVLEQHITTPRNRRYLGWDCDKLLDSIDSKIVELKDLVTYYDDINNSSTNFKLKLSNLYHQIVLLVILIKQSKK